MERILIRFPVVGQTMFKYLDDKNLAKCREVSKFWQSFLDNNSLLWKRKIQRLTLNHNKFKHFWKLGTEKVSIDTLKKLAIVVEEFFTLNPYEKHVSPHHVVAKQGTVSLFKIIFERTLVINPVNR